MGYIAPHPIRFTAAMKEKDELRLSVLRMVKSALKHKEIEKMRPLDDLESMQILQTLVKQRHESAEQFTKGGPTISPKKKKRKSSSSKNICLPPHPMTSFTRPLPQQSQNPAPTP